MTTYARKKWVWVGVILAFALVVAGCSADLSNLIKPTPTPSAVQAESPAIVLAGGVDTPSQTLLDNLYKQVDPSVVSIRVTKEVPQVMTPFGIPSGGEVQGLGSGFVYDEKGHIVTNNHVVEDATSVVVYFYDGSWADAKVVAADPQADLAVVKVDIPKHLNLKPLPLAEPDTLAVGHWVAALGSPFGLENSMTLGIVSALSRGVPVGDDTGPRYTLPDVIQTDTPINPGNSGGPLLNLAGEVVGVNFAIRSPAGASAGVGFAIPVHIVRKIVPALIKDGKYEYPWLGIAGGAVNDVLAEEKNIPEGVRGVWVSAVTSDGPAEKAGLKEGDIITAIDDTDTPRFEDLVSYLIRSTKPNQKVKLHILRDGKEETIEVKLGKRPTAETAEAAGAETISIAEAIKIARKAVEDSGLIKEIESSSAARDVLNGRPVWAVTLSGNGKTALVAVDALTGEVLSLQVK